MPDRQNYVITNRTNANVNLPRRTLTYEIRDSNTNALLGTKSILFPERIATLTAAQRDELIEIVLAFLAKIEDGG